MADVSEVNARLDSFLTLEAGWDTYEAEPICPGCVTRAKVLVDALAAARVDVPWPCPCADGGIQLEWSDDGRNSWVYIPPDAREANREGV